MVASWNCNHLSMTSAVLWKEKFSRVFQNTIVCLQESENITSTTASEIRSAGEDLGFTIVGAADSLAAICIPSKCDAGLSWRSDSNFDDFDDSEFNQSNFEHAAACVVGNLGIVSTYFPHAGRPLQLFVKALSETHKLLSKIRTVHPISCFSSAPASRPSPFLILCCDLNFQLSEEIEDMTGSRMFARSNQCGEREDMFLRMLSDFNLTVVSTFDFPFFDEFGIPSTQAFTRVGGNRTQGHPVKSQLDYICCDRDLMVDHFILSRNKFINSDHRYLRAHFSTHIHVPIRLPKQVISGWKPLESDDAIKFKKLAINELALTGKAEDSEKVASDTLCNLGSVIESCAFRVPHSCKSEREHSLRAAPYELRQLTFRLSKMKAGSERNKLLKIRKKVVRKFRANNALVRGKKKDHTPAVLQTRDGLTANRDEWQKHLHEHCTNKYSGVFSQSDLLHFHSYCLSLATSHEIDGRHKATLDMSLEDVLVAKSTMTKGTSSGGDSLINTEMLCIFPIVFTFWIYFVFRARFFGKLISPASWLLIVMIFFSKSMHPRCFDHFRGIALLDNISKWYSGAIVRNITRQITRTKYKDACCFAYTPKHCCGEIVLVISNLLRVAYDWRGVYDLFVFSGDIKTAFDNCPIISVGKALLAMDVSPRSVAAYVFEQIGLSLKSCFFGIEAVTKFEGVIKQGGRDGPAAWSWLFRYLMSMLHEGWVKKGCGVELCEEYFTHATWSDNIFLFASCISDLDSMVFDLTCLLSANNMFWKAEEMKCFVSGADVTGDDGSNVCLFSVTDARGETFQIERASEIKILGCNVSSTGATETLLEGQLAKGRKAFFALKKFFCCRDVSCSRKLVEWRRRVLSAILSGIFCVTLTQRVFEIMRTFERSLLCLCFPIARRKNKKGEKEPWVSFHRRHVAFVEKLICSTGVPTIFGEYCKRLYSFALKTFSVPAHNDNCLRFVQKALREKNSFWWHELQILATGAKRQKWRHSTAGKRTKRWEDVFVHILGDEWHGKLSSKHVNDFVVEAYAYIHIILEKKGPKPYGAPDDPKIDEPPAKSARIIRPQDCLEWSNDIKEREGRVLIVGDNKFVCNTANGHCKFGAFQQTFLCFINVLFGRWKHSRLYARDANSDYLFHAKRDNNKGADALATAGVLSFGKMLWGPVRSRHNICFIRGHFDGGFRDNVMGCGVILEGATRLVKGQPEWKVICEVGTRIGCGGNAAISEMCGFLFCFAAICDFWESGGVVISPYCSVVPQSRASLDIVCAIDELLTSAGVVAQKRFSTLRSGRLLTGI